jgi:hypothetical protein
MYDIQLSEALIEIDFETYKSGDARLSLYSSVFAKHGVTQAQYDSSLVWYGKNLDLYMQIYKLVLKDVNASIANLGDIKPNPLSGDVSSRDSVDVWIFPRSLSFSPAQRVNLMTFDIEPKVAYSSGSSYVLSVRVWGTDEKMKHYPKIALRAVQPDTIVVVNKEITADGYYEILMQTAKIKQVKRVYGYMMLNSEEKSYSRIYIDDIRLMKYNYGSKALKIAEETDSLSVQPLE